MTWRERMTEFLSKECERMGKQVEALSSGKCQLWEMTAGGERKDVTEDQIALLRNRLAECEQIMNEEGFS